MGSVGTSCGSAAAAQPPRERTRGQAHAAARSISRNVCVGESWLMGLYTFFYGTKPQNHQNIKWLGPLF